MISSVGLTNGLDARITQLGARTIGWFGDWLDTDLQRLKFNDLRERGSELKTSSLYPWQNPAEHLYHRIG